MRYWYIDSAAFVTLMLIDKGYYDYDYEQPKEIFKVLNAVKNDDDLKSLLNHLGIKGQKKSKPDLKDMTMEELQAYAMAEAEDKN